MVFPAIVADELVFLADNCASARIRPGGMVPAEEEIRKVYTLLW
jgi:hypothetical protein